MSLNILKIKLQECLNECTESEDFKGALSDGIYGCQLETETALKDWVSSWSDGYPLTASETEYQVGVQFVADTWKNILDN